MAEILPVEQRHRDAAADVVKLAEGMMLGGNDAAAIRNGIWDADDKDLGQIVQAFARFERDHMARPEPGGVVEAGLALAAAWDDASEIASGLPPIEFTKEEREHLARAVLTRAVQP